MTTWLTKELTLDLLAITIDGLNKAFNAISGDAPSTPLSVLEPKHPADESQQPAPVPAPQPGPDVAELRATAQQLLRGIANNGGGQWIAGTLFPHFGIDHLDKLPADKWEELITMAQQHTEEA